MHYDFFSVHPKNQVSWTVHGVYFPVLWLPDNRHPTECFDKYYCDAVLIGDWEIIEKYPYSSSLLGLGGSEKVDSLDKVKIREHTELVSQMVGKVGM